MKWKLKNQNDKLIKLYNNKLNTNHILSSVLINRNIRIDDAYSLFNNPYNLLYNPYELINVDKAINKILYHIDNDSEIHIFADYDVDGLTSGLIMTDGLQRICNNAIYPYYPERTEGFGINIEYVNAIIQRKKEIDKDILVITVDNGTTRVEEINKLINNNIDVIVTDHHRAGDTLPNCIVVNPYIESNSIFKSLSGCGVAFEILYALYDKLNVPFIDDYLYAVALGTIADIMPLDINNIALCMMGINQINNKKTSKGFNQFVEHLKINTINSQDIAWEIAPRLNACGRMENIDLAANLLFCNNDIDYNQIKQIVLDIEEVNQERKKITKKLEKKVDKVDFSNNNVCIYYDENIISGLTGILASKIANKYNKPSIVLSESGNDILSGSVRSSNGIDILKVLKNELNKNNIINVGGHSKAAGLSLKHDKIDALQKSMDNELKNITEEVKNIEEEMEIDNVITLSDINNDIFNLINSIPYSNSDFRYPIFAINNLKITNIKESSNNPNNVKITFQDSNNNVRSIWGWRMKKKLEELEYPQYVNIAGSIKRDFIYNNNCTFDIQDIQQN